MLITDHDLNVELIKGFPVEHIITNVGHVMQDHLVTDFYGQNGHCRSILLECGQHEEETSFRTAIAAVTALLHNLDMCANPAFNGLQDGDEFSHYHVENAVFLPDGSYELTRIFPNFEPVKRGEVICLLYTSDAADES